MLPDSFISITVPRVQVSTISMLHLVEVTISPPKELIFLAQNVVYFNFHQANNFKIQLLHTHSSIHLLTHSITHPFFYPSNHPSTQPPTPSLDNCLIFFYPRSYILLAKETHLVSARSHSNSACGNPDRPN